MALVVGTSDAWAGVSRVLFARLEQQDRASAAWALLRTLEPWVVIELAHIVLDRAGMPLTLSPSAMDDARFWAAHARRTELKAHVLAAYERMPLQDRADFLGYIQGRAAA